MVKNKKILKKIQEEIIMTLDKVKTILADHLEIEESTITEETSFKDLGVDSLDTVEILMEMEDEFGIEIQPGSVTLNTVKDLVDYIDSKLN